jgi:hypothetical protein
MTTRIAISLVPADAYAWPGELRAHKLAEFMDRIVDVLLRSGLVITAIIGFDLSFNVLTARGRRNRWQLQTYIVAVVTDEQELRRYLKSQFPKSKAVPRPSRVKRFDGTAYAASYAFKYQHSRRVSFLAGNGRWTTKKRRLLAREHIELLHVLAELGLEGRIRLIGIDHHRFRGVLAM